MGRRKNNKKLKRQLRLAKGRELVSLDGPIIDPDGSRYYLVGSRVDKKDGLMTAVKDWRSLFNGHAFESIQARNEEQRNERYSLNYNQNSRFCFNTGPLRFGKHANRPAYVLGGGPSLLKNVHELANIEGGVLITANRAIERVPLEAVEKAEACYWHTGDESEFPGLDQVDCSKWTCVALYQAHPKNLARNWKKVHVCNEVTRDKMGEEVLAEWPNLPQIDAVLHSGFSAFFLAAYFLCNPIIFLGMDYSFSQDEAFGRNLHKNLVPDVYIQDIYGREVLTDWFYLRFSATMAAAAELLYGEDGKWNIWNCTEGGILKGKGIVQRKLKGAISEINERMKEQ